jgi:hypothetical protein
VGYREAVNLVSGPIVAVMGTAEGVIVKARELIGAALGHAETAEEQANEDEADVDAAEDEANEDEPDADTARMPALAAEARNGQTEG